MCKKTLFSLAGICVITAMAWNVCFSQTGRIVNREFLKQQEQEYRSVLEEDPENVEILKKLVRVLFDLESWSSLEIWGRKLLHIQPDIAEFNYMYAVCQRELGEIRPPLVRALTFNKAEKHFRKTIEIDPEYRDVYFQWSQLKRARKSYIASIELAMKQMSMDTTDSMYEYEVFKCFDYALAHVPADSLEPYLMQKPDSYKRWALGELYRRNNLPESALKIFNKLIQEDSGISLQPVYLSMVRTFIAQGMNALADETYWSGIHAIHSKTGAKLAVDDLLFIVNQQEYRDLKSYKTWGELRNTIKRMWVRRNLMPAMAYNSRLIEHYKRLDFAEMNYRYDGMRHKLYKADKVNRLAFPEWYYENYKLNDMAIIYIRYGEPDDRSFAIGDGVLSNMSWLYRERKDRDRLIFHFYIAPDAPPNYWTLSPMLMAASELDGLYDWDPLYYRIAQSVRDASEGDLPGEGGGAALNVSAISSELVDDRTENVIYAMKNDEHTFSKKTTVLPLSFVANRFRESSDKTLVQFAYGIPFNELFSKTKGDSVTLETGITVFDKYMDEVYRDLNTYTVPASGKDRRVYSKKEFIDVFSFHVPPEEYNVAIHCRIPETEQLNGSRFKYTVPAFPKKRLAISTLMLAHAVEFKTNSDRRYKNNLRITPNPKKEFSRKDPLYIYYELYNLAMDEGKTDYTVTFNITQQGGAQRKISNLFGVLGGGKPYTVSVTNDYSGDSAEDSNFISFDMQDAGKGTYVLALVVKDEINEAEITESVEFVIK